MALVDIKAVEAQAKKEIQEETSKAAVEKLKELYRKREKAQLIVRNIENEIQGYLAEVSDTIVYDSAGVDTAKS